MDITSIFLTLWNMSLTGSMIILFVLLARLVLRKAPRVFSYALWLVVLFRLLCPISFSSALSVLSFTKAAAPVPQSVVTTMDYSALPMPEILPEREELPHQEEITPPMPQQEIPVVPESSLEPPVHPEMVIPSEQAEPQREFADYAAIIWMAGLMVMVIYNGYSCVRLFRQIEGAIQLRSELFLADYIPTAFVLGIVRPKIYLPSYLSPTEQGYIIAHERCHIKRKDHIFRLLGYVALCLHWFNPLVWLAFILSGKDMEMSCDEAVIRMYGPRIRAEYSQSLLRLATGHRSFALTPLAFGEGDTKERVINMSKWKKPKIWATLAALAACVAVLVACALNPASETEPTHWDREKDIDQICIDAMDELLEAESYYIIREVTTFEGNSRTEYRRHGENQLVLEDTKPISGRVYLDGKLGIYQSEPWGGMNAWVWQGENPDYDPDAWLREWSPEYIESGSCTVDENTITLQVKWPHPYNEKRHYEGKIIYTFNPNGSLNNARRDAVLMEGDNAVSGLIDSITPQEHNDEGVLSFIREKALECVSAETWEEQHTSLQPEKVLADRKHIPVRTVDEFLAAIMPNTDIVMEGGIYDLSKASNYGQDTGSEYYYWRQIGDGYELVIRRVDNFVVQGAGVNATTIETPAKNANVIKLEACYDVWMNGFTAGHSREIGRGECGGGVLKLVECSDVEMSDLGLYGCGIEGLITEEGRNITLKNSAIYDCSSSAAVLQGTDTVSIFDCNIYNIGVEPWGGYSIFTVEQCAGVEIKSCSVADSHTTHFLSAQSNIVTVRNCLVSNNRFEDSALNVTGWNAVLAQNRFRDNNIRNWYRMGSTEALDENGKTLTEELLDEMYGTLPQTPNQPQIQIRVSTVDEFIAAIGSNKEIILEPGTYNLQTATGYGYAYNDSYFWNDTGVDGYELVIRNVDNMTIRGAGDREDVVIEAEPRYANVLNFHSTSNITVSNFTAGHTKEQGSCTGGVLFFKDSDYVDVEACGLFGCGTEGVYAEDSGDITVKDCEIYECSEGGVELRNCIKIRLENNTFRDIAGREYILILNCVDVQVDGEEVINGKVWGSYAAATEEQTQRNMLDAVVSDFVYCYFWDRQEEMQQYLAESYEGDGATYSDGEPGYKGMHFEITFEDVAQVEEKGSVTVEIPYRPYRFEDGDKHDIIRYLLVTAVKENGQYKISEYRLKQ